MNDQMMTRDRWRPLLRESLIALGFVLLVNALGALPAAFVGSDTDWIERPWFYPPEILFPIVWTLLFTLMGVALYLLWRRGIGRGDVRVAFLAFAVQFLFNIAWTPAFFGLQRPDYGLIIIVVLWVAIVGTIIAFARVSRVAAALLVPYLLWVSFAVVLNYAIYLGT